MRGKMKKSDKRELSLAGNSLAELNHCIIRCRKCPRLVAWREQVAQEKRAAYREEEYWGRPLIGFGDVRARVLVCGLAPAAHGGNRTGRIFTGDRSGDWLYGALHRAGFANQPVSIHRNDGLRLRDCYVTACVRCAPPANRPTPQEFDNCRGYLAAEFALLPAGTILVALGALAFDACLRVLVERGEQIPRPRPRFAHGASYQIGRHVVLTTYHPSQQNTFTGKLTQGMLREVFRRAKREVGSR